MATSPHTMTRDYAQEHVGWLTLVVISLVGLIAFLAPFWQPVIQQTGDGMARSNDSLLITVMLSAACLVVLFANLGPSLSTKSVALLGVLVAINATLRAADLSFLPPGEFSPIFLLITLVGYIFGAQLGFLMGALTMLCSALLTGGIGPWLPFQMFCAGWMGMTASWLPHTPLRPRREVWRLAAFGFAWGFVYGMIINLYSWPFIAGQWSPGTPLTETLLRYAAFYAAQSVGPDLLRAAGNMALVLALGAPLLRVFRRFRSRFDYAVVEY